MWSYYRFLLYYIEFYYPTLKYVCGTWVLAPSALTSNRSPCRLWTLTGLLTVALEQHWLLDWLMFIIHIAVVEARSYYQVSQLIPCGTESLSSEYLPWCYCKYIHQIPS